MAFWDEGNVAPPAYSGFVVHDDFTSTRIDTRQVLLKTNLAGQPISFNMTEGLEPNTPFSTATLTMLNAAFTEAGNIEYGVFGGFPSEESTAIWGHYVEEAEVEPNALVIVWEIRGPYKAFEDSVSGFRYYEADVGGEICATTWRVVSLNVYEGESGLPYCEVELESMKALLNTATIDPLRLGSTDEEFVILVSRDYYDESRKYYKTTFEVPDYYQPFFLSSTSEGTVVIVNDANEWLQLLLWHCRDQFARRLGYSTPDEMEGSLNWRFFVFSIFTYYIPNSAETPSVVPAFKRYLKGDNLWEAIQDVCGMNGKVLSKNRAGYDMEIDGINIVCSNWTDVPPGGDPADYPYTINIMNASQGLHLSYSKEGVVNKATVEGYAFEYPGYIRRSIPYVSFLPVQMLFPIESSIADGILNGDDYFQKYNAPDDVIFDSAEALQAWGQTQITKTLFGARGTSVSNSQLPLKIEPGRLVYGLSELLGVLMILVTSVSRSTEMESNRITTSITGIPISKLDPDGTWSGLDTE